METTLNETETMMEYIPAKTIITRTKSMEWFGTRYNMNIYRGCNHGCIYCDSRSNCYHVENFSQVKAKENALEIIRNDLRRKVKPGVVGTGAMSDPYNSWEEKLELTRHSMELLSAFQFGVAIATKSDLIVRDIDILQEIQQHSPVLVKITITTPHDAISRKTEPHVSLSSQRLAAIEKLSHAGIPVGVLLMPVLPWIHDNPNDIQLLVKQVGEAGGKFIYPSFGLTMRDGQREYFYQQLEKEFLGLKEKYQKQFDMNYQCPSPKAKQLYGIFQETCKEYGILTKMSDIIAYYKAGYGNEQLKFF